MNQDYLNHKIIRIIVLFLVRVSLQVKPSLILFNSCSSFRPENPDSAFLPSFGGVGGGFYSYLNASTGFLVAAFKPCQLTVSMAITSASNPARTNISQLSSVL